MKSSARQWGFTFIELIMVLVIISVISMVIGKVMFQSLQSFSTAQNVTEGDWQGFVALERMTNDIHNIGYAAEITTISASQLNFTDASGTAVQYNLSGTNLMRNSEVLSSGVTALSFAYYNNAGATTTTPAAVRYIAIVLSLAEGSISTSFSTLVGTRGMP